MYFLVCGAPPCFSTLSADHVLPRLDRGNSFLHFLGGTGGLGKARCLAWMAAEPAHGPLLDAGHLLDLSCPPRRGGAFCSEANAAVHHGGGDQPHESGEALWGLSQGRMKGEFSLMAGEGHGKAGCPRPHNHLGEGRKLGSFPEHLRNHTQGVNATLGSSCRT